MFFTELLSRTYCYVRRNNDNDKTIIIFGHLLYTVVASTLRTIGLDQCLLSGQEKAKVPVVAAQHSTQCLPREKGWRHSSTHSYRRRVSRVRPLSSCRLEVWRDSQPDGRWWKWRAFKDTWYAISALVECTSNLPDAVTHSPVASPAQLASSSEH